MEYDKVIIITLSIVGATLTWLLSFVLFVLRSDNKKQDMKMDEILKTLVLHSISLENHNEKILQNKVGVSDNHETVKKAWHAIDNLRIFAKGVKMVHNHIHPKEKINGVGP